MRQAIIAPSILAADYGNLEQQVKAAAQGGAEYLHIDVMDGSFVPNITFGQEMVAAMRRITDLVLDVHLMTDLPERFVESFASAGADILTFHLEATLEPELVMRKIHALGKKAGISVCPATPVSALAPYLDQLDAVLLMAVNPGFGGQSFHKMTYSRIRELSALTSGKPISIEVDGGVNFENAQEIVACGADVLVTGTTVFKSSDITKAVQRMDTIVNPK